jgi:cellobiose phosphorylase
MRNQSNIALGFYRNTTTALAVLKKLRKAGLKHSLFIHHKHEGGYVYNSPVGLETVFPFPYRMDPKLIACLRQTVVRDETLVVAILQSNQIAEGLEILREVETGHPVSFLLRGELSSTLDRHEVFRREPLTQEQLVEHASNFAADLGPIYWKKTQSSLLLDRLRNSAEALAKIRKNVAEAEELEQTITISAEWLLDNNHVIQANVEEVQRYLPKDYYNTLPKLSEGPLAGYPRIYAVARDIVEITANRLNRDNLVAYLESFQSVTPLTIGELWALPLMLRFRLIECLHFLALQVESRLLEGEQASFWGNRLLVVARREPERVNEMLQLLESTHPNPTPHFAEEVLDHLFDEDTVLPIVTNWLQSHFTAPLNEVLHNEQIQKTVDEVSLSNAVISLIALSQISWSDLLEAVSIVDQLLKKDPAGIYPQMDFNTRDSYRHAIETLSKHSKRPEVEVTNRVLEAAKNGTSEVEKHVGYYLIDAGRPIMENALSCSPNFYQGIRRYVNAHDAAVYLGVIFSGTALACVLLGWIAYHWNNNIWLTIGMLALAFFPISEVMVQLTNLILNQLLPPTVLPKLHYERNLPEELRSLVVVPMKLTSQAIIEDNLHHLEVHYLANPDPALRFALFDDFEDAREQHRPEDNALLTIAVKGIEELDAKYGPGKFFLFHRNRSWSPSENAWIGKERKRGKLYELNRYLVGEFLEEQILKAGDPDALKNIRYIITLDADTQLPKDKAKQLIATAAHPLNIPRFSQNGELLRGYSIIQPRVSTGFSGIRTLFNRLYSDIVGVDPYTLAVSDVYQDLSMEGTYHGKGLYDLHAFHRLLKQRYPEEHLLSHDLIEGAYARAGFASDIVLFDQSPADYLAWSKRAHRWMRGDWQIIDWLKSYVPDSTGLKKKNTLSWLNRWKIFDNLRRALLPLLTLAWLVCAWFFAFTPGLWTLLVIAVMLTPAVCVLIGNFVHTPLLKFSWMEIGKSFVKGLVSIALLPHEAYLALDAMIRVFWRRNVSHRHFLEWATAEQISAKKAHAKFLWRLSAVSLFGLMTMVGTYVWNPIAFVYTIPFCLAWILNPVLVYFLDKPVVIDPLKKISHDDIQFVRQIGRRTWCYFDEFVNATSNWLPPDNYQAALQVEVAQRTSPTNIGLYLLAVISANDLGYISSDEVVQRIQLTMDTLKKLELYDGHLLNWFDTQTMKPLYPRYVSTVDSGNFLASLWTLNHALDQLVHSPIIPLQVHQGFKDTVDCLIEDNKQQRNALLSLKQLFKNSTATILEFQLLLNVLNRTADNLSLEKPAWIEYLKKQLRDWESVLSRYYSWLELTKEIPEQLKEHIPEIRAIASKHYSLNDLAAGTLNERFAHIIKHGKADSSTLEWANQLQADLQNAQWYAGEKIAQIRSLIEESHQFGELTNMNFLYNPERKLFTIGYHVDDCKKDNSYYDLLASECRISSLVAIAKGDVPLEHWWALGRPYGIVDGRSVLLSWGGTMFEYLMPLLFNIQYPTSLIGQGCWNAVYVQRKYGESLGIPWGISEAAYSELDARRTYQYRSFGVPGLGLKRGLKEDLVISPYSTALALAVDPYHAIKNFKILRNRGMLAQYGYYESIDFTRQTGPKGDRGVTVFAFMAHHQGMSLLAINNLINQNIMPSRFHCDPRISGVESLTYERIPAEPRLAKSIRSDEMPISRLSPFSSVPIMGIEDNPNSPTPKVSLLGNTNYSLMITNAGGGYTRYKEFDITRWRADTTCDNWGSFCYIKDTDEKLLWSTTYQPTCQKGTHYSASFKTDKVEFRRKDHLIEAVTEIFVSPEDNAEIRLITLANLSNETRHLELTTYSELVLAPHNADRAHPAFNKLFIETEYLPEFNCLLAHRRMRSNEEKRIFAAQIMVSNIKLKHTEFETDRSIFLGRNGDIRRPEGIDKKLTNSLGTVLDPIFSLRSTISLDRAQRCQVAIITLAAETRDEISGLIEKSHDIASSQRALEFVWTHAQLELRHLRIHQDDVQLYSKLASRMLYPHSQLRASPDRLRKNKLGQARLWPYGISGDLPIVVVSIDNTHEVDFVRQMMTAHAFWRMRGLKTDLVILNEEASGYDNPLNEQLKRAIYSNPFHTEVDKPGGIYLRTFDQLPEEDVNLLLSVARAHLIAARGSFRQQLVTPLLSTTYPARLVINRKLKDFPSRPLPFEELPYFNGIGGYTKDGREYVMYLGPGTQTPQPWINVMANPTFGTMISNSCQGTTWYGNSQSNRITPWSNDPVLDPVSEAIYIRDDELGTFWSPTPNPVRELDAYRIRHGQGYTRFEHNSHGIQQELLVFVPVDDNGGLPVKIQRLRLTNQSNRRRTLSVMSYADLTMGTDREETQMHVITEWDTESQAMFIYNRYNPDFGSHVAFNCSTPIANTFTGNRTEFLGRNNSPSDPSALHRECLSGNFGPALDSCSALHVKLEIDPNETIDIAFLLGYAPDDETARKMVLECRNHDWIERAYMTTKSWWDKILSTIQIDTMNLSLNFAINRWILYQDLSCRFWGRAAFYQSSGAFGFRDQLQDSLAFLFTAPQLTRAHILRTAARQFEQGDVQHWWHPPAGGGVRTRISDDLLWLPLVTAHYVKTTQDRSILDEMIPFLKGPELKEKEHEMYFVPEVSEESASLLEHCRRSIQKGLTSGPHGIPLIGGGDWNDGMNRVGLEGRGESIWLGWFIVVVLNEFADLINDASSEGYRMQAKRITEALENGGWDGEWYRRAYFDDGTPLGSSINHEDYIDSLPQSWAVISGKANPERARKGLESAWKHLVWEEEDIVLLLTPAFDKTPLDPGYIKGYPPGVRENGGQYTHGSLWMPLAYSMMGDGDKAARLLQMMHPISHTTNPEKVWRYRIEPYVLAGDVYSLAGKVGRGGWSWYSGSAGWLYRIWLENMFGFKLFGDRLRLEPTLPSIWPQATLAYRFKDTFYVIEYRNPKNVNGGSVKIEIDGKQIEGNEFMLNNDGLSHKVIVNIIEAQ